MLSLPNGCLCCSFKDMGIAAIEEMVAQQRDKVDWVVVELTGVADPGASHALAAEGNVLTHRSYRKELLGERGDGRPDIGRYHLCGRLPQYSERRFGLNFRSVFADSSNCLKNVQVVRSTKRKSRTFPFRPDRRDSDTQATSSIRRDHTQQARSRRGGTSSQSRKHRTQFQPDVASPQNDSESYRLACSLRLEGVRFCSTAYHTIAEPTS